MSHKISRLIRGNDATILRRAEAVEAQRDAAFAVLKAIAETKVQSHFDDRDFDGNDEELCWLSHVEGIQRLAADFLAAQEKS